LIDRAHRPDWEAMRKSARVIDVPGLPKPNTDPQT
jgi:hypothetical protein